MWRHKNINFRIVVSSSLLMLAACQPNKPVDRSAIKEEMEARELRHVSDAELMARGEEIGKAITEAAQHALQEALKSALAEGGVPGAVQYCHLNALTLVRDLEDSLEVSIRRVTNRPRNPLDTLSSLEKQIWEAYEYSPENAEAQIQVLDKETLLFTKPIRITNGLCLNCHGAAGETLTPENHSLINQLYPEDQATGYRIGDLRGIWRVILPKKTVVKHL